MKAVDIGIGARAALHGRGRVIAVYRKAMYLRFETGLVALTGPDVPPGPLHLRCKALPPTTLNDPPLHATTADDSPPRSATTADDPPLCSTTADDWALRSTTADDSARRSTSVDDSALPPTTVDGSALRATAVDDWARVDGSSLVVGTRRISLDAPTWSGMPPAAELLRSGAGVGLAALAPIPPARLLAGDVPAVWPSYAADLAEGDLRSAARMLGGRGAGLTPAGDDVLAGLLLVAAALGIDGSAAAASVRTNEIAAAFLHWAARGHGIAPAHELLAAAADQDLARAVTAVRRLCSIGASSGADLAYGLALGLRHLVPATVAPSHPMLPLPVLHDGMATGNPT